MSNNNWAAQAAQREALEAQVIAIMDKFGPSMLTSDAAVALNDELNRLVDGAVERTVMNVEVFEPGRDIVAAPAQPERPDNDIVKALLREAFEDSTQILLEGQQALTMEVAALVKKFSK